MDQPVGRQLAKAGEEINQDQLCLEDEDGPGGDMGYSQGCFSAGVEGESTVGGYQQQ